MMIQEKIEYVSHLWDKLSPRERLVKFHFSNSLILYKDWKELSLHESDIVMNAARICGLDHDRIPEPTAFSAAKHAKVETHH